MPNLNMAEPLILPDSYNDIIFKRYECLFNAPAVVLPFFLFDAVDLFQSLPIRYSHRQQNRILVHTDDGFPGKNRFLEFRRKRVDVCRNNRFLREIQNGNEQLLQLVECQVGRNLA